MSRQTTAPAEERLEFEALLVDTSAALISAAPAAIDTAVEGALERLRAFFDVDRAGLLTVSHDRHGVSITHEAYGPGVPHVPTTFELERLFPWSYRLAVVEQRAVVVPRVADLPPEAAADRASWTRFGAGSNLTVPVASGGVVTHLVSLGAVGRERPWPVDFIPRVRLLGEMCVSAVLRARIVRELQGALDEARRLKDFIEQENVQLRREIAGPVVSGIVSSASGAMRQVLQLAAQVAATDATVLITGETGTGKERVASFIHEGSARAARHMVRVNCSAIPAALIESELFGREKGAYTGALTRQIGRFELAHGSTLFLDEIGDLSLEIQVKLLRVLQERTIERLGSPSPVPVDVRIIAATNRDLGAAVRAGTFRSDLFYRLNVFPLVVPPLRARREDIPALVETLLAELSPAIRKRFTGVTPASLQALSAYEWPGNVRELRNALERAMILAQGPTLTVDVPGEPARQASRRPPGDGHPRSAGGLREWERERITQVLLETGWRIRGAKGAAAVLDLKPTTLEKRMVRLGIRRPSAAP